MSHHHRGLARSGDADADPSEAAIIIGYPAPSDRGFYLAVWQTAKALGPIVGGAINLGLNVGRSEAGSVG
jgi:sugar phosphate permease